VRLHVANSTGRLDRHLGAISTAFTTSVARAEALLGAAGIDVVVVDAPDDAIPEWGVGGTTPGPHVVVMAIDADRAAVAPAHLERTLLHELHHAMRWRRHDLCGDLGDMLVSEGLAQLFEHDVLGSAAPYAEAPIDDDAVTLARGALHTRPCDASRWFFGSGDVARHFGYAYGYVLCRDYAAATGASAASLLDVPTLEVLEGAGLS